MNGIDAVAIATGQDWRAIESGAHSYATITGKYQPLTTYEVVSEKNNQHETEEFLKGRIELPISIGTKGGAIQSSPAYAQNLSLLGFPTTKEL